MTSEKPKPPNKRSRAEGLRETSEGSLSLIEQLAVRAIVGCKNPKAPILFGENPAEQKSIVVRAYCKQWNCPTCGARNAKQWIAKALHGINEIGGQWYFMTLTVPEYKRGLEKSYETIKKAWPKLRKRIVRLSGKFEYLKVHESHKDGTLHLHFILNAQIPYTAIYKTRPSIVFDVNLYEKKELDHYTSAWLKDNAHQCGFGYIADYQPLRNNNTGTAYYVAKYLTKSIGEAGEQWPKNIRRIETSTNWPKSDYTPEEENEIIWQYVENIDHLFYLIGEAEDDGRAIYGSNGERTTRVKLMAWYKQVRGLNFDQKDFDAWLERKQQEIRDMKTAGLIKPIG